MSSCCGPSSVTNSSLFANSSKVIKFSKDRIVANSGPNVLMDLDLCGLNIPFDQIFRTQLRLPKQTSDISLMYENILGNQTTFVAIKVTYDKANKIYDDNFIEYYFVGQPDPTRTIGKLMILTGTETKPIPPIALNNPSTKYGVIVDVMAATTKVTFESLTQVPNTLSIDNLLWTDILSDPTSGDLIVYKNGTHVAYVSVDQIISVELNGRIILIDDRSAGEYTLIFIDDFNANQANSLITWALADRSRRITIGVQADTTPPFITYTPTFNTTLILNNFATTAGGLNYLITKQDLIALWIESVIDNRDGNIAIDDSNIIITPLNSSTPINAITNYGRYNITIQVDDAARNRALDTFVLNVKNLNPPKIVLKTPYSTLISQNLPIGVSTKIWINDYPFDQINKQNLIDLFLQQVIDTEDGNIPLYATNINVTVLDNLNHSINNIGQSGTYNVSFSVSDSDQNIGTTLWSDVNTQLVDQFNVPITSFNVVVSENQPPIVQFVTNFTQDPNFPGIPSFNLYQFNINGIINKSDLYSALVASVTDDRTPVITGGNITLIQNRIFDQFNSAELVFIDSTTLTANYSTNSILSYGLFTFTTQHQDTDGAISTYSIDFIVIS